MNKLTTQTSLNSSQQKDHSYASPMKQSVLKQPHMLANRPSNIALQALVMKTESQ